MWLDKKNGKRITLESKDKCQEKDHHCETEWRSKEPHEQDFVNFLLIDPVAFECMTKSHMMEE